MNGSDPKQIARELLEEAHPALIGLSHWIHANPELGYQEVLASGWVTEWLTTAGFEVRTEVAGMPTAVIGSYGPGPLHIAVCVEYDALPAVGHACGHNVIAAAGVGAGLALAAVAEELGLRVTVMGTPAEETGGGKIGLIKAGEFEGAHPRWYHRPPMPELQARVVAFVERHPKYFPDAISAVGELIRVLGDVDPFLIVDADGQWLEACAEIDANFRPTRWIARRILPTGEYRTGQAEGMRAEQLVRRADGRPSVLVATEECPTGENEDEPGGESFGYTTLIGRTAGMRRIGVNLDVVRPGQRSVRYHWHREEEEGFLVLGGSGWLDVGGERFRVVAGDFFAKPEGPRYAHQFVNDGEADLRILSIGERRSNDVVELAEAPWEPELSDEHPARG